MDAAYFDTVAHCYDNTIPAHVARHYLDKRIRFFLSLCQNGTVLDVGCGTGTLARALMDAGPDLNVTGTDDSEEMLVGARKKGIRTQKCSSTHLTFPDESFDLVYCVAVMHHIGDPEAVRETVREMFRVCRRGGHVVLWDHNPWNPYWKPFMKRLPQDAHVHRLVPAKELVAALQDEKARTTASTVYLGWIPDFCPPRVLPVARHLEAIMECLPVMSRFAAHHVVTVSK